jgi:hypothetical protein
MSFNCLRCSKCFTTPWNLKRHNKRKTPCIAMENVNSSITIQNSMPISQNSMPILRNSMPILQNSMPIEKPTNITAINIITPINLYMCIYCNKSYSNKSSKYKHQEKCKISKNSIQKEENVINIKALINKLKNTDKSLVIKDNEIKLIKTKNIKKKDVILNTLSDKLLTKKIINNITNNITNNNNMNNSHNTNSNNTIININAFGKENLDSLSLEAIQRIFSKKYGCYSAALKEIYANIPENNNFYIANKGNSKYMKVYNGKKCDYELSTKFNTRLSDNTMTHIENLLDKNKDKLIKKNTKYINKVLDDYHGGEITERYKEEGGGFILNISDDMKAILCTTLKNMKNNEMK